MLEDDQQYFPMETRTSFDEARATFLSRQEHSGLRFGITATWQLLPSLNPGHLLWEVSFKVSIIREEKLHLFLTDLSAGNARELIGNAGKCWAVSSSKQQPSHDIGAAVA
jgi:hypothetical protein